MKRIISIGLAGMLICGAVTAQSIKIANTFGGDADNTGGSDLFTFENQKNEEEEGYSNERVSNRLQLDASGNQFDGRMRLEFAAGRYNGKESTVRLRGYGRYKPVNAFQVIAGNDFSTKAAVDAGYLAASDDSPKFARILQSRFGALSNLNFGDEKRIFVKFGAGLRFDDDSFLDINKLGFDAGYIYNNTDTDYITKKAKNSVSFTAGYKFTDLIPFLTKLNVTYKVSENITVGAKVKVSMMIGNYSSAKTEVYPNLTYKLLDKFGTVTTGIRMTFDKNGIAKFAVPINWKCTLAEIKK